MSQSVNLLVPQLSVLSQPEQVGKVNQVGLRSAQHTQCNASSWSQSNASFSQTFSPNYLVDRCVMLKTKIQVVLTSTAAGPVPDISDFALACSPLNRVIKSCKVTVNNSTKTSENHLFHNYALGHYQNDTLFQEAASLSPQQYDAYNNLWAMERQGANAAAKALNLMPVKSPFRNRTTGDELTRGCFKPDNIVVAGSTITITYTIVEGLFNPYLCDMITNESFANVRNIDVDLVFNDLRAMMSVLELVDGTGVGAAAGVAVTITEAPVLQYRTYLPSVQLPSSVKHKYPEISLKSWTVPTFAVGSEQVFQTGNFNFSTVPKRLFLFARPSADITGYAQADAACPIKALQVRHNLGEAFVGCSQHQLYQMSRRNGLNRTWTEFSDNIGSVICIDVDKDLGGYISGTKMQFDIDISVTLSNTTYQTFTNGLRSAGTALGEVTSWKFIVLAELPASLTCDGTIALDMVGESPAQVAAEVSQGPDMSVSQDGGMRDAVGSGFGKDFLRGMRHGFSQTLKIAGPLAGAVAGQPAMGQSLSALGKLASGSGVRLL